MYSLLPLAEEYQINEVKRRSEEFLMTKPGSMELLITAQTYGLTALLAKCVEFARHKSYHELQKDPYFPCLEPENLISILTFRVQVHTVNYFFDDPSGHFISDFNLTSVDVDLTCN